MQMLVHRGTPILKRGWTILETKYLDLLAQKYDCEAKVVTEIINLKAILNLPKGTEHFVSDLHGNTRHSSTCCGMVQEE